MTQAQPFWSQTRAALFSSLESGDQGLASTEAGLRLDRYGPNALKPKRRAGTLSLLIAQFTSPIILLLLCAVGLSLFLGEKTDAVIILIIVLASGSLGFFQERGARDAMQKLLSAVQVKSRVRRDGRTAEIPLESVVPGDVVFLGAGDMVPADCYLLESGDLYVDEAALTGETFPQEKAPAVLPAETALARRANSIFMGTHVISGQARALAVKTGGSTEFGQISERLRSKPAETEFEHGVHRFGYMLMESTLILVIAIFAINVFFKRPVIDSFLFALALAVGLTPQLLPAIISINLAHGAKNMARRKVIVKKLAAIENFGSMNVLCSDKTGTLTDGEIRVKSALGPDGQDREKTLLYACLNAAFQSAVVNPVDQALQNLRRFDPSEYRKLDEVPYDFMRKRLSILVQKDGANILITKGALPGVLGICTRAEFAPGREAGIDEVRGVISETYEELTASGFRVLGVAYRSDGVPDKIGKEAEKDMIFLGFLVLYDPPKAGIEETVQNLNRQGVALKIVTGDSRLTAVHVGRQIGLGDPRIMTGEDLHRITNEALTKVVSGIDIFAEIEPNHKERIITALKKAGHVVGYLGDGINDAPALHAADVGISVDNAVDVAKEAADIVLMEKDLAVLSEGVRTGRTTFANTLKYVFMATSANFGNMFSMAAASLFLPFLPLLPKQILLTNFLTDFPEMTIATDRVDPELVQGPRRWDLKFIRRFMIVFGLLSSIFDFITFGLLKFVLHSSELQFRTGWFLESVISASIIVLVIRSRRPFFKSPAGAYLMLATAVIAGITMVIPFSPLAGLFGFVAISPVFIIALLGILAMYILAAEITKHFFYKQ